MTTTSRREPRQQRGWATVDGLLDAADALVAEHGPHALTTTAVARRAGVAVGTVYQYFADVHALEVAVVGRHLDQMASQVEAELSTLGLRRKRDAANAALDAFCAYHRTHAGFRWLWPEVGTLSHERLSNVVVEVLVAKGLAASDDAAFRREADIQWAVAEALVALAFRRDPNGDPAVLAHLRHLWDLDVHVTDDSTD
jgi:AcrR family transcriptional regulator